MVAAGDIACPPGLAVTPTQCQQGATAALARRLDPSLVLTLGDHQYNESSLAQFNGSYAKSWGALRPRTRPTIGNHEYLTPGAGGYYTYFRNRQPGPPGYYRVAAGAWQVFVLNSNCDKVSCAREATWLDRQMKAHPSRCSMITMHHPRYSSGGEHGNDPAVIPLWRAAYKHHNDLVLSGHEHDYERFKRMDAVGHLRPSRGMLEFVVGTGGRNLYPLGTAQARLGVLPGHPLRGAAAQPGASALLLGLPRHRRTGARLGFAHLPLTRSASPVHRVRRTRLPGTSRISSSL